MLPDGTALASSPFNSHVPDLEGSAMFRLLTTTAVVASGLMITLPVCAQTAHPSGAATATAPKEVLSQQDKDFVSKAAEGGMAEVELSRIAERSENPEVKRFA